ncbi:MAG: ABC transporter permease [Candidatus Brockarchaeota archaeon]|nr:ABC transporter permease [Candidatus Brockarchaeota archaeon]
MEVPIEVKQIVAFTKRDFHSWATYKTAVMTQIVNIFIGVFSWGVGATYVQKPVSEMYGSDYISFLVVGIAIGNLVMPLVQGVERQLNPWTIETILMTGISTPVFVIGNVAWSYIFSVITFIPYLLIGIYVFNVRLNANVASVLAAFAISAAILMGLAMISTGLRIVTKSTDPITWAINILQNLFSGITFPVLYLDSIFFPGASSISWFLPQTWVYHLCRLSMLTNPSITDPKVLVEFTKGASFAVVLFPIGYKVFSWGVARSKREGTLGWY